MKTERVQFKSYVLPEVSILWNRLVEMFHFNLPLYSLLKVMDFLGKVLVSASRDKDTNK